ncbi:MAG: hypothetical protein LBS16_01550 [Prevotellaceae bacterium]|jgi:outer membrane protein X|nr:hypothetical protein [Prevotellaceae bacterium]
MKKLLFATVFICGVALSAQAQGFSPFRVDGGIGYGLPFTPSLNGGVLFYAEPRFELTEYVSLPIAVGLRWEGSLFGGANENNVSLKMSSSYLLTGDYYFTNNKFRPFAGLGLGICHIGGVSGNNSGVDGGGNSNFGALLRAGFDVAHFRLTLAYNYGGTNVGETFHYFGATLGFYIGGGQN